MNKTVFIMYGAACTMAGLCGLLGGRFINRRHTEKTCRELNSMLQYHKSYVNKCNSMCEEEV